MSRSRWMRLRGARALWVGVALVALTLVAGCGEQEDGVSRDGEGWGDAGALGGADLSLVEAEELFFVSDVDLDVPATDVCTEDLAGIEVWIGAYQEGWVSVQESGP